MSEPCCHTVGQRNYAAVENEQCPICLSARVRELRAALEEYVGWDAMTGSDRDYFAEKFRSMLSESIEAQAQEIARLQEELDRTVRCTDDCERVRKQDAQDAAAAQHERDAQVCDERAKHHAEMFQKAFDKDCGIKAPERLVQKIEAQACAAAIRAARTSQEPT